MNIAKIFLYKKSSLIFIALFFLSFCYMGSHIIFPSSPFISIAEAEEGEEAEAEAVSVTEAKEGEEAATEEAAATETPEGEEAEEASADELAELEEAEEEFIEEEEEEEEEAAVGEEVPMEIPMGTEPFPEFKGNPENPNRDMVKREDYNDLPVNKFNFGLSNRNLIWVVAQLHILFASFILGVPLYTVIAECLYWKTRDERYERLAYEVTKVFVMCYSFTALTGGFFALCLIVYYPTFTTWFFRGFNDLITFWYPMLFLIETGFMYLYYYTWDPLNKANRKGLHILIGILLNIAGISLLFVMDGPAAMMTTPPKIEGSIKEIATFGEWAWFNNYSWMPLNYHRLVGNLTFGGYLVGVISAIMYIFAKNDEERAYYDWQGYTGNTLGVGFLLPLPLMGYYLSRELYAYDPNIGMYIMSDRLSMYMEVQAVLVGFLFIGSSYYIYVSMQRIQGDPKYLRWVKINFAIMLVCAALWFCPRHVFATMVPEPGMIPEGMEKSEYMDIMELSGDLAFMGVMGIKNKAAFGLVFVTFVNFVLYRVAMRKGKIVWGKINPISQISLIFLAFSGIWLMSLMGAVRSLARRNFHVYRVFKDMTVDAYTPALKDASLLITEITLVYFLILSGVIWLQLKVGKTEGGH